MLISFLDLPENQFQVHEETSWKFSFLVEKRKFHQSMSCYLDFHLSDQVVSVRWILFVVHFNFHAFRTFWNFDRVESLVPFSAVSESFLASGSQLKVWMTRSFFDVQIIGNTVKIFQLGNLLFGHVKKLQFQNRKLEQCAVGFWVKGVWDHGHFLTFVMIVFTYHWLKIFFELFFIMCFFHVSWVMRMNHRFEVWKVVLFPFRLFLVDWMERFWILW